MRYVRLYKGLGLKLIIPYGQFIDYPEDNCPICKENISNGVDRYTGSNDPSIRAFPHGYWPTFEVPFGYWYRLGNNNKPPKLLRKATREELF